MGIDLKQTDAGDLELVGGGGTQGTGFIPVSVMYIATSVDQTFFVADRAYRVKSIIGVPDVAGTNGSAVTATIRKAASGTALTSGTALHSGTFDLKGTVATNKALTLSTTAGVLDLAAGDRLVVDFTGTLTSAVGAITVALTPR